MAHSDKIYEKSMAGIVDITEAEDGHLVNGEYKGVLTDITMRSPLSKERESRLHVEKGTLYGRKDIMCFDKGSYVISPIHPRNSKETAAWKRKQRYEDLPTYILLCELECREIFRRFDIKHWTV